MLKGRLHNLDIIKIMAAFAICFHHYQQCFKVQFQFSLLNMILPLLGFMVELFFIISGFFAAKSLDGNESLKSQYLKKIFRLYPYAFISVAVTAVLMLAHYILFGECIWGNKYTVPGIITSFFMINQGWVFEFAPALNNPIWYICVMLWLYLLYYCLEYMLRKFSEGNREKLRLLLYCSIALIGGIGWHFSFSIPFLYLSDCRGYATFFIGIMLYELLKKIDEKKYLRYSSLIILLISLSLIIAIGTFNWYLWVYIMCPAILICGVTVPQIKLNNTATISEITFQLYLWHVPCFYVFQFLLDTYQIKFVHSIFSMIVTVALCIAVSILIYHFIDLPISKKILNRRRT